MAATQSCARPATEQGEVSAEIGASARAFGAIGDGQYHPLSTRFKTLFEARQVYPFVERLDQSLDWAGIQAAIDSIEASAGTAVVPIGHFVLSDSLKLPSAVTLQGESRNGSVLDNQYHTLGAPQIINKDTVAFLYATIRDLTLNGGTHAIKIRATREVAGVVLESLTTNLQSEANITFSSMQTTVVRDCHLMDGRHGISVEGFPCNSVHVENTRLGRHSDASIRLRGADGFLMIGGSIEAGGLKGRGTIDLETGGAYANALSFQNVYFENTHEYLLRSRGAKTVVFRGCKVTGTGAGGLGMGPYRFDCEDDLVVFENNHWDLPTAGPKNMLLQGRNDGLGGHGTVWRERSGRTADLESRPFSSNEAKRGLFSIDLGGRSGRAYGDIQLTINEGDDRQLHRLIVPVEIRVSENSASISNTPLDGYLELSAAVIDRTVVISMPKAPDHVTFQFSMRLVLQGGGAMTVTVL